MRLNARIDGSYLADALRACGGMIELKLTDSKSPMLTSESQESAEPEQEQAEPTEVEEAEKAEAVAKTEKPKRKRSKAKEPVAVA